VRRLRVYRNPLRNCASLAQPSCARNRVSSLLWRSNRLPISQGSASKPYGAAMAERRYRVLAVAAHPLPYMAPILRRAAHSGFDLHVALEPLRGGSCFDPEYAATVEWCGDLVRGCADPALAESQVRSSSSPAPLWSASWWAPDLSLKAGMPSVTSRETPSEREARRSTLALRSSPPLAARIPEGAGFWSGVCGGFLSQPPYSSGGQRRVFTFGLPAYRSFGDESMTEQRI
jgi:hypothetical protein